MTRNALIACVACLIAAAAAFLLYRRSGGVESRLQGQTNLPLTFYGKVVDERGDPLRRVKFTFQIESYPKDWTFSTRVREHDFSYVSASSGIDGRFEFSVTGSVIRLRSAEKSGYREFFETDISDGAPQTRAYRIAAWSRPWHKTSYDNPATFVFLKDGVSSATTLPARGGSDGGNGTWTLNHPQWPKRPSLTDVTYHPPTTQPTNIPSPP